MRRLWLMIGVAMALTLGLAPGADARKFKGAEAEKLAAQAAAYMATVNTLTCGFDFINADGRSRGHLFINRELQAIRMQFGAPLNHLLLVKHDQIKFYDSEGRVIETSANGTPLAFLLRPQESLATSLIVLEAEESGDRIFIVMAERGNVAAGQVILQFQRSPKWTLLDWGAFDGKGRFTQTVLGKQETGLRLDAMLFQPPR
jgi:hypothetical protein